MTPLMAVFTYLVTWNITLFVLLPVRGLPTLKQKMLWNTALAALVTLAIHLLLRSGWIELREAWQ